MIGCCLADPFIQPVVGHIAVIDLLNTLLAELCNQQTDIVQGLGGVDVMGFVAPVLEFFFICAHSSPVENKLGFMETVLTKKEPFFHQIYGSIGTESGMRVVELVGEDEAYP